MCYPAWMGALGDDRKPGEMRDIAKIAQQMEEQKEAAAGE